MIYKILIIGHILGDFYFQTDKMAIDKKENRGCLFQHVIICYLSLFFCAGLFVDRNSLLRLAYDLMAAAIFHGFVDLCKIKLELESAQADKKAYLPFIIDQSLHIAFLFILIGYSGITVSPDNSVLNQFTDFWPQEIAVTTLLAVMLCWKPASVFVSIVFKTIPCTMVEAEKGGLESVRIGSFIGILEREIILILGLLNQFGAIGFVLTAKSLARFRQLENKAFAEKYLVGTLLSAIIALACVFMCQTLI